jgi:hypothetical protein
MEGELSVRKPEMLKGNLLIAQERADEPRETLDEVRKRLLNQGKLND